jgi:hypothetical protein
MSSSRASRSARAVNKAKGITLPVDNRPIPGSKKRKTRATPVAPAAAVADTPVAAVPQRLDFTFENAWLARVTHGLSKQEVGDMLAGSLGTASQLVRSASQSTMGSYEGAFSAEPAAGDHPRGGWGGTGSRWLGPRPTRSCQTWLFSGK